MVDLVADDDIEPDILDFAERPLAALEVIERGDDPRLGRPGVGTELDRLLDLVDPLAVEDLEVESELGVHLVTPLLGDTGWADDQDTATATSGDQLAQGNPGLDRFPQTDIAGVQDPGPRQCKHPQRRDLLVKLEPDPGSSGGHKGRRWRGQGQKKGLVQQSEAGIASRALQGERRQLVRLDRLQGVKHGPLAVPERSLSGPDPQTVCGRVTAGNGMGIQDDAALPAASDAHSGRERHAGAPKAGQVSSPAGELRAHTCASDQPPSPLLARWRPPVHDHADRWTLAVAAIDAFVDFGLTVGRGRGLGPGSGRLLSLSVTVGYCQEVGTNHAVGREPSRPGFRTWFIL